jgi:peptidoglycan DL-endopeptidase LytE
MGFRRVLNNRAFATVACAIALLATSGRVLSAAGQTSKRPRTKPHAAGPQPAKPVARSSAPHTYKVSPGDTLYSIARKYSTSVKALQAENNLKGTRLNAGQTLRLTTGTGSKSHRAATREPVRPEPHWPQPTKTDPFAVVQEQLSFSASDIVGAQHSDPLEPAGPEPSLTDWEASALSLKRLQLVSTGFGYVGVRYRWNGTSEKTGFDCSGLVKKLFDQYGISLPRSAREQFKEGVAVAAPDLEIGDLVFFGGRSRVPTHVAIYVGERSILHAQSGSRRVIVSDLDHTWYKRRFLGARRIPGLWATNVTDGRGLSDDGTR